MDASLFPDATPATFFPFEKLPMELKLMVLRFTIPKHGLRSLALPLGFTNAVLKSTEHAYVKQMREEDAVPTGLFQTSKWISAQTRNIFTCEVYLHIDVYPLKTWCYGKESSGPFFSQLSAEQTVLMKRMRKYKINIRGWDGLSMDNKVLSYRLLKENLRDVCDGLMENENLQQLTFSIPCLCSAPSVDGHLRTSEALPTTLEYLSPLARLRVLQPVTFFPAHSSDPDAQPCRRPICLQLVHSVQAQMNHLNGKELEFRESWWKWIKATQTQIASSADACRLLGKFWDALEAGNDEEFAARAKYISIRLKGIRGRQEHRGAT
ncbi:MAG: hypothetical protein Q9209_001233 [Squamulea sp. 1 TL-2023]